MKGYLTLLVVLFSLSAFGQTCMGKWLTFDDETYKKKSIVKLYKKDGVMYGRIEMLYPEKGREDDPDCTECTGSLKNKKIVGMLIIRGMKWNGSEWTGGTVLDPENGKKYKGKIWIDPNNSDRLKLRGYSGIFYRTQTWTRTK